MKNIYVITGGPGFGKTTVIKELEKGGFYCGKELSREFIREQLNKKDGKILPWENRLKYSEIMLGRKIKQYEETPDNTVGFFDRGIPDLIAYIIKDGFNVPEMYFSAAKKYRYKQTVFLTPPWKKIHKNDLERKESFEEAENIHDEIKEAYQSLSYICLDIPQESIKERVQFILNNI